jgi:hypothetical protein
MNTFEDNEIIDTLRKMLNFADPKKILEASKRKDISIHMRNALEHLALESLERSGNLKNSNGSLFYKHRPQKKHPDISKEVIQPKTTINKTETDQIYEILIHSKQFSVKTGMMNLVKLLGFDVVFSKKDSRARAARKLAMAIASSPEQIKKKALPMLYEMSDNQTRGWIDIIRSK